MPALSCASAGRNGSYPTTFIPRSTAASATSLPIAPRPITPSVLPLISGPANADLPFSTVLPTLSPSSLIVLHQSIAFVTFLDESKRPRITSSFTAFAFAPGVLKTTMPLSAQSATGILFVPAPALAIARSDFGISISCIDAERTIIASGFSISSP